jgi:hypothetical protein
LACCGALLIIDEEETTIRFIHHSVRQFLLERYEYPNGHRLNMKSADGYMAQTIITYLSYSIFDNQVSELVAPQLDIRAAPERIICTTLDLNNLARNFALQLLRSRKTQKHDIRRTLAEARSVYQAQSASQQHRFHAYAKAFCQEHILSTVAMSTPIQMLLSNLLRTSKLGDTLPESSRKYLLEWAVYQRMGVVLRCLLEGPDITQYFGTAHKEKLVTWTAKNASKNIDRDIMARPSDPSTWNRP